MKVYFYNKPVLEVTPYDLNQMSSKGIITYLDSKKHYAFNKDCKEISYLFSPKIKTYKKYKYLNHINKNGFKCEDCGNEYSFHVRPYIEEDGSINFKKIVNVCKDCRTKLLKKKDILTPQFKKRINWPKEKEKIRFEIKNKNVENTNEYFKLCIKIIKLERFAKLVLPPLPKDINNTYDEILNGYKKIIEKNLGNNISLDSYINRKIIRDYLFIESDGKCPVCGKEFSKNEFTIDHIIARDLEGKDTIGNFIGMCNDCNKYKDNMSVLEFLCSIELEKMPLRILKEAHEQQKIMRVLLEELKKNRDKLIS